MSLRKIIEIDRNKCNGCGLCTTACAEGALILDEEKKARLVREIYCDGLGACLDVCPTGALRIVEREGDGYDSGATQRHVLRTRGGMAAARVHGFIPPTGMMEGCSGGGCPGSLAREIERKPESAQETGPEDSELTQWPVQLHLISPSAPSFQDCDLLIAADCTAFALGGFHSRLLKGRKLVIACPKLDETGGYVEKLAELIRVNRIRSLTVAVMTVPCCTGLRRIVEQALQLSGRRVSLEMVVVDINGRIVEPRPAADLPDSH